MKPSNFFTGILLLAALIFGGCNQSKANTLKPAITEENTKIQVALLLDTSNSMDGLIDQAKSRLWNIVNTLTTLKYSGKNPDIEIALYEYGNDGLSMQSNFIRKVAPLTSDLDLISEKLFSLKTNGGSEYCGAVIADATKSLEWGTNSANMKLIYIAGNEIFNQGPINYKEAISDALRNGIYVNTIFCGNQQEGINLLWKDGANYGKGKYFNIDSNQVIRYVVTPYDDKIKQCNITLNNTYISYGRRGREKKMNQMQQDSNAGSVSSANYAERAISKSKRVYKNESWDLVDKMEEDQEIVSKLSDEQLPTELKGKTKEQIETYVVEKSKEREAVQKEMAGLAKKRQAYIDAELKKTNMQDDLGNAISFSLVAFAKMKGYSVEK